MTTIGKILVINLTNGFYFTGRVIDETEDKIIIIDKFSERVEISKDGILTSREVSNG